MKIKPWRVLAAAGMLLAIAAAAVALVSGGCSKLVETAAGGSMPMKCVYAIRATVLLQLMAAGCLGGLIPVKCKVGRRWLAAMALVAQVFTAVVLYTPCIGLCGDAAMHCHVTAMAVMVLGLCSAIVAIAAFALADPKRAELPKRGL